MSKNTAMCLIIILFILLPTSGQTRPHKYGEVSVNIRNSVPCFYYERNENTQLGEYELAYFEVSSVGKESDKAIKSLISPKIWTVFIEKPERGKKEANCPETCMEYGFRPSNRESAPPKALLSNTPYKVMFILSLKKSPDHTTNRIYHSYFCITRNKKSDPIIVKAGFDDNIGEFRCLKPGEPLSNLERKKKRSK